MMKHLRVPLAAALLSLAACAGDSSRPPEKPPRRVKKDRPLSAEQADQRRLFKLMLTVEALEPVTGESDIWKAAVSDMPGSPAVKLLEAKLGGRRFSAYDVEAGTKIYRARFAAIDTGDPVVEVLWTIDGRNYPVRIGAPEGYREAAVTGFPGGQAKTLTGWTDGVIDLVVTSDPVIVEWGRGVKAGH